MGMDLPGSLVAVVIGVVGLSLAGLAGVAVYGIATIGSGETARAVTMAGAPPKAEPDSGASVSIEVSDGTVTVTMVR